MVRLLSHLCAPVCRQGRGVLLFCSSKADCATTARELAAAGVAPMSECDADEIVAALERQCTDGVDPHLVQAIRGVVELLEFGRPQQ